MNRAFETLSDGPGTKAVLVFRGRKDTKFHRCEGLTRFAHTRPRGLLWSSCSRTTFFMGGRCGPTGTTSLNWLPRLREIVEVGDNPRKGPRNGTQIPRFVALAAPRSGYRARCSRNRFHPLKFTSPTTGGQRQTGYFDDGINSPYSTAAAARHMTWPLHRNSLIDRFVCNSVQPFHRE